MERIPFSEFKKEALKNSKIKEEYEKLKPIYEHRKNLLGGTFTVTNCDTTIGSKSAPYRGK